MPNPLDHPATASAEQLLAECEVRHLRRSGPGGQHRNKVQTAVSLRHLPTGVQAEANERRSQSQNRAVAVFRLRVNLALQIRSPRALEQFPTPLWQSRIRGTRLSVSAGNDDFPALLADALDVLAAGEAEPKQAVATLGGSPSQLIRLLKLEPRALALVNSWRAERGLHAIQ